MIKKAVLFFLCFTLFLSIPSCKKKLPTSPDLPNSEMAVVNLENAELYFSIDSPLAYVHVSGILVNCGDAAALNVRLYVQLFDANGEKLGWDCTIDVFDRLAFFTVSPSFTRAIGSFALLDYVAFADAEETLNRIEVKFESE